MSIPNSLPKIQKALSENSLNMVAIVNHYLNNIEKNKDLNAFNHIYADAAIKKAAEVQKKIDSNSAGALAGLVIGIKDNIAYKDHPLQASSKILDGFSSNYNASVTEKLLREDAIIIGSLNCDEFAMGSTNENSHFGPVLNPHDKSCVPGGSSGGSAVAVAKDMCLVSLGTDTGGSVRMPASYCGVVGFKPTYGRISRFGIIAYASSFDQVGVFSKNIADCAIVLENISGNDENDATSSLLEVPNYFKKINSTEKYSFAFLDNCINNEDIDKAISQSFKKVKDALAENGHITNSANFNMIEYLVPTYYILTTAEASSNLARYDGIHYGYRSKSAKDIDSTYISSRSEGFGDEVKRRIMLGTFVLSSGYYDAYYSKAKKARRLIKDATDDILENNDFIILPTTPDTAFKIGEKTNDPVKMYLSDIFTVQANLTGIPAISLPLFKHSNGMPFGIQLMSKKFDEAKLLNISNELMNIFKS